MADDVGLIPCPAKRDLVWVLPEDFQDFPPRRPVADHKGSFGHVGIVAGSLGYHGAGVLTSRGAQRAQPGLVTVYPQDEIYFAVAPQLQSAMVHPWRPGTKLVENLSGLLVGPGLAAPKVAENLRQVLHQWWRDLDYPMVVDASALDYVSPGPFSRKPHRVITPHPGEAGRLL